MGGSGGRSGGTTVVLVHGAGHTAAVWDATRATMRHRTVAVDLPGRGRHGGELASVTVTDAADSVVADLDAVLSGDLLSGDVLSGDVLSGDSASGDVVLVGHSVAGTILPTVAVRLGPSVRGLVFVAGIAADDGVEPLDVFLPDRAAEARSFLAEMRVAQAGRSLEEMDVRTASSIDSLNFSTQPMRWSGLSPDVPRTWVRCLRDPIQPPDLQQRFIDACGAHEVVDVDSGHTPAVDDPVALAAILDAVVERIVGR